MISLAKRAFVGQILYKGDCIGPIRQWIDIGLL